MHRRVDHAVVPVGWTVVLFSFPDVHPRARDWWLVITSGEADVCDVDPGYTVAVTVTAGLRHMVAVWRGDLSWRDAMLSGVVDVHGPEAFRGQLPRWSGVPVAPRDHGARAAPSADPGAEHL
ncbi:hypothetical protein [Microbispora sp. H13382]|uniref:hypothetical protein n=1 Tax=Microbispora sp. H13382 TaxID=2729112 RepID=UPI001C721E89|nr:hypothetical protein [Microbispora sp. H13382]